MRRGRCSTSACARSSAAEIADIFRNNSLKNGLLPIVVDEAVVQSLMQRPDVELTIDVEACELRTPAGDVHPFPLEAFARNCLMHGVDELGYLLLRDPQISKRYEERFHAS